MILDTSKLLEDFKAVIASAVPSQKDILVTLKAAIDERLIELEEDTQDDNSQESTS